MRWTTVRDLRRVLDGLTDNCFVFVQVRSGGLVPPHDVDVCDVVGPGELPFVVLVTDIDVDL